MAEIIVAIPTFRRPRGLERLLAALEQLETQAEVEVIVADNDAENREGFDLCVRLRDEYRWPLASIVVPERGIAAARNALVDFVLAHSRARFVAMLDDDEWPDPQWLDAFLKMQRDTRADAVRGTILREFEKQPGRWAARCPGIATIREKSGPTEFIDGAGNVFISRRCFEELPRPCFDPSFAMGGGEDTDFFLRLKRRGKRFAWADDAICREFVPASRANLRWVLARAYSIGNSDMRVFLKFAPARRERVLETARIAGAILLYPLLQILFAPVPERRAEPLCKLYRAMGKIAAVFGRHYHEYATVHGS